MSNGHLGELLSAYLDGEASREEEERIVLHLDGCSACRDGLLDLDAARAAVRSLPVLEPAAPLWSADTVEQPTFLPPPASLDEARRGRSRPVAWVAAAAAAVVLAIGGLGVARGGSTGAPLDMAEMMDQHAVRVAVDPGLPAVQVVQVVQP